MDKTADLLIMAKKKKFNTTLHNKIYDKKDYYVKKYSNYSIFKKKLKHIKVKLKAKQVK